MGYYDECLDDLRSLIPSGEMKQVMFQRECELAENFLGFIHVYKALSVVIPKSKIVIDFGCYLAAQSYYFAEHNKYIGVDTVQLKRFSPKNAVHYVMSIQEFIKNELETLFSANDPMDFFAICSFVPDDNATKLVRETFPNVCCYYLSAEKVSI